MGDLDSVSIDAGPRWGMRVTVTVHDEAEAPVAGATVTFDIAGLTTRVCTTDASGTCSVRVRRLPDSVASVAATVTDITLAGYTYDAMANHDPDGDSDGTTIVANQP